MILSIKHRINQRKFWQIGFFNSKCFHSMYQQNNFFSHKHDCRTILCRWILLNFQIAITQHPILKSPTNKNVDTMLNLCRVPAGTIMGYRYKKMVLSMKHMINQIELWQIDFFNSKCFHSV